MAVSHSAFVVIKLYSLQKCINLANTTFTRGVLELSAHNSLLIAAFCDDCSDAFAPTVRDNGAAESSSCTFNKMCQYNVFSL